MAALEQNLRWNPLLGIVFYPERLESEMIEEYLARYERHHRKAVDTHATNWFAGNKQAPENRNEYALLIERFRFALLVIKTQHSQTTPTSVNSLVNWALIGAWHKHGAAHFVRETSNAIRALSLGGHGEELIDEWLRMGA